MKRSEMLLKLQEAMVESPQDFDKAAEYILSHLEKSGMIYCEKRDLGNDLGELWTPLGWEDEE